MKDHADTDLDRELQDLPGELRWREWMRRVEAVLFASATPVPREDLARVVGQDASVDLLIDDLAAELVERPYEVSKVADGWMLRTRPAYAPAIRAAADVGGQELNLREFDVAVLAAWPMFALSAEILLGQVAVRKKVGEEPLTIVQRKRETDGRFRGS